MIDGSTFLAILEENFPDVPHLRCKNRPEGFEAITLYKTIEIYLYADEDLLKINFNHFHTGFKMCYYFSSVEDFEYLFQKQFQKVLDIVDDNLLALKLLNNFATSPDYPMLTHGKMCYRLDTKNHIIRITPVKVIIYTAPPGSQDICDKKIDEIEDIDAFIEFILNLG